MSISAYRALDAKLDAIVEFEKRLDKTMARVEETVCMVAGRYADDERITAEVDAFLADVFAEQEAAWFRRPHTRGSTRRSSPCYARATPSCAFASPVGRGPGTGQSRRRLGRGREVRTAPRRARRSRYGS